MAALQAAQAKSAAPALQAAPAAAMPQVRAAGDFLSPLASLSAVPAMPFVQRKCDSCEAQETEDELPVQPRLEVGPAADPFEAEADDIAARVMAMRDADISAAGPSVQRACSACASSDEEPRARRRDGGAADAEADEEDRLRGRRSRAGVGTETIAASEAELTKGGAPLPSPTRSFFEGRMGRDLSGVRVHQGSGADEFNASIAARAFTYRDHIWLGSRETASPSFTMAHELAHVMQQTAPGPVGPAPSAVAPRGEMTAQEDQGAAIRRKDVPFWLPGSRSTPTHAVMHNRAQDNIRLHNADVLTEVPIPGANRFVVGSGKCGFADFYTATAVGTDIPVPGIEAVETAPASGAYKLGNLDDKSASSCVGAPTFGTAKRGKGSYSLTGARAPVLDASGEIDKIGSAPRAIQVGELKPAHDIDYRGSGVTQLQNYISGLNTAIAETNAALSAKGKSERWAGSPAKMTNLTLPPGWDAAGATAASTWPINDLKIRNYKTVAKTSPAKTKGKKAATAKTTKSGSATKISGRWMLAKDSVRIPGGDGVYVYFLAPNPDELKVVLKDHKTSKEFKKLARKIQAVYRPLLATPQVKKAARKLPAAGAASPRRGAPAASPSPRPVVRRQATDPFDRKQWELLRTGSFEGETAKDSLAEVFATTMPNELREQTEETAAVAEWVRTEPEKPNGIVYDKANTKDTDAPAEDFNTLRKAAFWSGGLAKPIGLLRERFGQLFVKGYRAFEKVREKIRGVFKKAQFSTGSKSGIGAAAVKVVGKVFMQLGKVVLVRTADVIARCLQAGFAAFMKKQVNGEIDELIAKAAQAEADLEKLKEEVEAAVKTRLEEALGGYEASIKAIAEDAAVIGRIAGAVSEIVRIARLAFCASGLTAAGWGAIVTCLLSIADWVASKFDKSPLDWIIKRVMNSCQGRRLFAEALIASEMVRKLPVTLAQALLRPLKEVLPAPASEMVCDVDELTVQDLSMADFECTAGDGEGEGEGEGGGEGGDEGESEAKGGGAAETPGSSGGTGGAAKEGAAGEGKESGSGKGSSEASKPSQSSGGGGQPGSQGSGATAPSGKSTVEGGAVTKGDPKVGNGFIESGIDPARAYNKERVKVHVTINLGEHIIRDQPCTVVVVKLVSGDGGKYAEFYFPEDMATEEGKFRITYPDSTYYDWSPDRGPTKTARFLIRGAP